MRQAESNAARTQSKKGRTSMENRFGKKKISFAVLALLMALFTALFASSCGNNGNGSDSLPGGNESVSPIDKSATVADAHLPAYKTYATYPDLNVETLRARRDELVVGIIGSEAQKGYKKLFAEASKDGNVVDESIIVYDPDPENAKFDELVRKVNNYIGEEKSGAVTQEDMLTAAKLLYEDHDLNGLYGIYQTAYKFYANFVYMRKDNSVRSNGGYLSEDPDDLAGFKAKEIIANAKQILKKKLKISGADDETRSDCTTNCNAAYAQGYVGAFEKDVLPGMVKDSAQAKTKLEDAQKTFDFYYNLLFKSGKYEDETINASGLTAQQIVYGGENAEKAAEAAEAERVIQKLLMQADFKISATSASDLDSRLSQRTNKYVENAVVTKGLKTYMDAANEKVNGFGKTAGIESADTEEERNAKTDAKITELAAIEEYLRHFENLGEYTLELSGGAKKIDLKSVSFKDEENETADKQSGSDWIIVKGILNKYSSLTKSAVDAIRVSNAGKYGVSADATVSYNVGIANDLADALTNRYSATEKPKYNGVEIANGFANSYRKDGALDIAGRATKSVSWFLNVASITYQPAEHEKIFTIDALNNIFPPDNAITGFLNKIFPQEKIPTIKITALDKDGNEIKCFDANAKLRVVFGETASTERNINIILNNEKKLETATAGLTEEQKGYLKNVHSLKYYISFSVMNPAETAEVGKTDNGGNYLAMDEKEFEKIKSVNEGMKFRVELTFDKEKVQNASEFVAVGYGHSKFKFVSDNKQEIKDGDEDIKMTFFLENVTTAMSVGILSQDSFKNIALFVAIGVIALIAVVIIICAIVAHGKRKKYKVRYNAMGGKFSGGQRIKNCKNYNYPDNPMRKGYQFMGWYANKKCTKKFEAGKNKSACVMAYAKWMPQEKFEKLSEAQDAIIKRVNASGEYRGKAHGTAGTGIHRTAIGYEEDPRITKLEIEKLSYEAKKAEEERKAEEVRLQTIREIEAAKGNDAAKVNAEKEAEQAKLALQQALAEREALIALAKAEERNKVLEELTGGVTVEGGVSEEKVNEIVDKKLKEYDEQRSKEIADEQARINAELAAKIAAEQAEQAKHAVVAAEEPKAPAFDAGKAFDELKAEALGYKPADDLDFGLTDKDVAVAVKVEGDAVVLEADIDKAECEAKGFKVTDGDKLPVKMLVEKDEDLADAKELIEEVLYGKGYMKAEKAEVAESTEAEKSEGYELDLAKGKLATTPEEFLKLIRVNAKSYVLTDGEATDKLLMKAFIANGKVYMYLNVTGDGFNAADDAIKAEGLGSFMVVKTADDCKKAIAAISLMMRENGLVRYPSANSITEESSDKGFTYTLKA